MNNPDFTDNNLISNNHLNSSSSSLDKVERELPNQLNEGIPGIKDHSENFPDKIKIKAKNVGDYSSLGEHQRKQRRSKKEKSGRDFICKECGKSYLSNSSLYAHTKTQHPNILQQFKEESKISSGKEIVRIEKFISSPHRSSNTPIIYGFQNVFRIVFNEKNQKYKEYFHHPLFKEIYQYHQKNIEYIKYLSEYINHCPSIHKEYFKERKPIYIILDPEFEKQNYSDYSEKDKKMNCDEIFANYLQNASLNHAPLNYEKILEFIFLLRENVNRSGIKILKSQISSLKELQDIYPQFTPDLNEQRIEFCQEFGAEILPLICNEFIIHFISEFQTRLKIIELIEYSMEFYEWLFTNHYTKIKIYTTPK